MSRNQAGNPSVADGRIRKMAARQMDLLCALQRDRGWMSWYYLPQLRWEDAYGGRAAIKLSHCTTPSIAQVLLRAGQLYQKEQWVSAAVSAGEALLAGRCPDGGWPLYLRVDADGRPTPTKHYWDPTGPIRAAFKNSATQNTTLLMLYLYDVTRRSEFLEAAISGWDLLVEAQANNPLGLWCNTHPLPENDAAFGEAVAGLADDSGTPSSIQALCLAYRRTNDKRYLDTAFAGALRAASLLHCGTVVGWSRYYDRNGQSCDARFLEKADNRETLTAVDVTASLLAVHALRPDERLLTAAMRWADWAVATQREGTGWHRLYDAHSGQGVQVDGTITSALPAEVSGKVALVLLELFERTRHEPYLAAAVRYADFLVEKSPEVGWWATAYDAEDAREYAFDYGDWTWKSPVNQAMSSTPLALFAALSKTQPRYLQPLKAAILRLEAMQLACGAWAFHYRPNSCEAAGGEWKPGSVKLSRPGQPNVPHPTKCQVIHFGESGAGNQILAWELMNAAALLAGSNERIYHWQTQYGLPIGMLV